MELARIAESSSKGRELLFDMLKEWTSKSFQREVRDTSPRGCPWQSLSIALNDCFQLNASVLEAEKKLRRLLIVIYRSLSKGQLAEVLRAKLACPLSYFKQTDYRLEEALEHWTWYLYCLSFVSQSFSSNSKMWDTIPELNGLCVVRMPIDSVDLTYLTKSLQLGIRVLQLDQPVRSFGSGKTLHLCTYGGLWAPLLSKKLPSLAGSVVELGNISGSLAPLAHRTACIVRDDEENGCHLAVAGRCASDPSEGLLPSHILSNRADLRALPAPQPPSQPAHR